MKKVIKTTIALSLLCIDINAQDLQTDEMMENNAIKSSLIINSNASELDAEQATKLDAIQVIKVVRKKFKGKITNVELENKNGNLIYDVEVLQANGIDMKIIVDAGNGQILASQVDESDEDDDK